jgi:hypothetical protein
MSNTESNVQLSFDDEGFALLRNGQTAARVDWAQVREIIGFRRDPEGADLLCLGFRIDNTPRFVEVDEEAPEYDSLLERMYGAFPNIHREWWQDIARTLGSNQTTIHGLALQEAQAPSAAETYLQKLHHHRQKKRSRWRTAALVIPAIPVLAGIQVFLASWLGRYSPVTGQALLPILLVFVAAFWCPSPSIFFLLLTGFHLFEYVISRWSGVSGSCLVGELLKGRLSHLPLLGAEILIGMMVMLLAKRRSSR